MSEDRLRTMRGFIRGSLTFLGSQGITVLAYFLAQRIILSTITKEANGVLFGERRVVEMLLIVFVDLGLNLIEVRRVSQYPDRLGITLSSAMAVRISLMIPVSCIALLYSSAVGYNLIDIALWCTYCFISSRMGISRALMEIPYRYKMMFVVPAVSAIIDAVLFLGLLYANQSHLTPTIIITCYTISAIPGFIMIVLLDRGRLVRWGNVQWEEMVSILREAVPVTTMLALMTIHDKIDAMMLDWWSTAQQVGIYGAAYTSLSPITTTVPAAVSLTIMPVLSRLITTDKHECATYVFSIIRGLAFVAIVISAVMSILTPEIIQLVSKGKYADNLTQFGIFIWLPLPIYLIVFAQDAIVALGYSSRSILIGAALALSTLLAGSLLIPTYASIGATIAKVISVTTGTVASLLILRPVLEGRLNLRFIASLLVTALTGIVGYILLPQIFNRWSAAPINAIIVCIAAASTGLIKRSDVATVLQIIKARRSVP